MYKADLTPEDYIHLNTSKINRSIFAQFRGGILPLQVETGRFQNLPLEERIYRMCDQEQVEDEFHFLCICERYQENRRVLYRKANNAYPSFIELNSIDKFVYLMSNLQKCVIEFLVKAVSIRRASLYTS